MKASVRTINQQLSDNMSKAEIKMAGLDNMLKDKRVEGLKVQGEECVRDEERGLSKNMTCRQRRCRVECVGGQANADDRKKAASFV